MLKRLLFAAALALASISSAFAQGQFPSGYVQGNSTPSTGQGSPQPQSAMLDRGFGSTRGNILERGAGGWVAVAPSVTAGLPWVSNGAGADPTYQAITGTAFATQSANAVFAGPTSGGATSPTFRALVGADMPTPGASSLGGVQSLTCSSHNWFNSLSTSGVLGCTQPAIADISGFGTGVATALGVNVGTAGSVVVNGGALGTPSSGSMLNLASSPASHAVPVDVAGTPTYKVIPDCQDSVGNHINYTQSTDAFSCGTTNSGLLTGTVLAKTTTYAAASADCGSTITLGGSAQYTLTLNAASGYTSNCGFLVTNLASETRSKTLAVNGLTTCFLFPGQSVVISNESNTWAMRANGSSTGQMCAGRWALTAATTLFIRPDGSDSNDGLANSAGGAFLTANAAALFTVKNIDINGRSDFKLEHTCASPPCTINTVAQLLILPIGVGASTSSISFVGGIPIYDGDPSGTTLSAPSGCCDIQLDYQAISLNIGSHFTYAGSPSIAAIYLGGGAFANLSGGTFGNVSGGGSTNGHITVNSGAKLFVLGNYSITGNTGASGTHLFAEFQGYIEFAGGLTITCSGITATGVWALAEFNGIVTQPSNTFSGCGSVTGQRFNANTAGGVNSNGGGATYFPGNAGGVATSPGWSQ
jgi:hypothetical protein